MLVRKPTYLMTNMPAAKVYPNKVCEGGPRHGVLEGSIKGVGRRTELAQQYPTPLVDSMLKSIKLQKQFDSRGMFYLGAVELGDEKPYVPPEEEDTPRFEDAWGDVNG